MGIKRRTGVSMPKHLLLKMAFDSGYEAGAEDAGRGELLVETLDLRYALFDLDDKTKRAIALDELVMSTTIPKSAKPAGRSSPAATSLAARRKPDDFPRILHVLQRLWRALTCS